MNLKPGDKIRLTTPVRCAGKTYDYGAIYTVATHDPDVITVEENEELVVYEDECEHVFEFESDNED